jgi:hypothetical protein
MTLTILTRRVRGLSAGCGGVVPCRASPLCRFVIGMSVAVIKA